MAINQLKTRAKLHTDPPEIVIYIGIFIILNEQGDTRVKAPLTMKRILYTLNVEKNLTAPGIEPKCRD